MSDLKQLTQDVFDLPDCPPWAKSAAVDGDGAAYWHNLKKESMLPYSFVFEWQPNYIYPELHRFKLIDTGYDTTNWQQSAISRGE